MPALNLVEQNESAVKWRLEESLRIIRDHNYALERDHRGFLREFAKGVYYHFSEGNRPLISGLKGVVTKEPSSI